MYFHGSVNITISLMGAMRDMLRPHEKVKYIGLAVQITSGRRVSPSGAAGKKTTTRPMYKMIKRVKKRGNKY